MGQVSADLLITSLIFNYTNMERTPRTMCASDWTVEITINKVQHSRVISGILVVGNDVVKISRNPHFLLRVYQGIFGRKNAKSQMDKERVKVIKIELLKCLGESFSDQYD